MKIQPSWLRMLNKKNKMKKKKKQQQPMGTRKFKMKIGIMNMMLRETSTQFEALPQAQREKFSFFFFLMLASQRILNCGSENKKRTNHKWVWTSEIKANHQEVRVIEIHFFCVAWFFLSFFLLSLSHGIILTELN